jgi:hypothetical protein
MPYPWVYSATSTDGKITFSVEVTDFDDVSGAIQVTGEATQVNGALAPLSRIFTMADSYNGQGDDQNRKFVDVEADPAPSGHSFDPRQDVTVYVQLSEAWSTVLGPGLGPNDRGTEGGPTWGNHKADTHLGVDKQLLDSEFRLAVLRRCCTRGVNTRDPGRAMGKPPSQEQVVPVPPGKERRWPSDFTVHGGRTIRLNRPR